MQSRLCHAIRCRIPLWSCRALQSDIKLHRWHAVLHWVPDNLDQGREGESPSDLWSQVPVWQPYRQEWGRKVSWLLHSTVWSNYTLRFFSIQESIHSKTVYSLTLLGLCWSTSRNHYVRPSVCPVSTMLVSEFFLWWKRYLEHPNSCQDDPHLINGLRINSFNSFPLRDSYTFICIGKI